MRKVLIPQNRFGRYLFYAVGEIVLVVVGILIALQINIWNEERKLKLSEEKFLANLKENIELNIKNLEEEIKVHLGVNLSRNIVLKHLRNKLPYHDSLSGHFHKAALAPNNKISMQAYESLKINGIKIIDSDSLRKKVIILFENIYPETIINIQKSSSVNGKMLAEYVYQNFERANNKAIPNNYNSLLSSSLYKNILINKESLDSWYIRQKSDCIIASEEVIKLIEEVLIENGNY